MSFLNTLAGWQWALFGLVPVAIVLLYFLKLKREPLVVPSTYLWLRTVEDLHVNAIWQRLRRNLLLLLQLLLIAVLALALWRPGRRGTELVGHRFLILIDQSASMQTTDEPTNRLEAAKRQATQLVDRMQAGDVAMAVAFSDTPQIVQTFTESRRLLRQQIAAITATPRRTDLEQALRTATGLANPDTARLQNNQAVDEALPATLYLVTDGGFPAVTDFALGNLTPLYLPVGKSGTANRGIVGFATDRNPEDGAQLQAFALVANEAPAPATVTLELFLDDVSLDVVELSIPAWQSAGWTFDLPDLETAHLKLVLSPTDALAVDNVAYAVVNRPRQATVLVVTPGNVPLQTAVQTKEAGQIATVTLGAPSVLDKRDYQRAAASGQYDLVIFDRCAPTDLPQANTLFVGAVPPGGNWTMTRQPGPPVIIDVDHRHPLTQLVDMEYVQIATGATVQPPPGGVGLLDSAAGPVLAVAPRDEFQDAVLGFTLVDDVDGETFPNTTWLARPSFPVFMFNVLRYLGGVHDTTQLAPVTAGDPVSIRLPTPIEQIVVRAPDGSDQTLLRQGQDRFVFTDTDQLGIYTVRGTSDVRILSRFAVNLCNAQESRVGVRTELEIGHEPVRGQARLQPARQELWKWAVMVGLLIVLFEWYLYNRRISVPRAALR